MMSPPSPKGASIALFVESARIEDLLAFSCARDYSFGKDWKKNDERAEEERWGRWDDSKRCGHLFRVCSFFQNESGVE
jgi:hypothetical protein